MGPSFLPVAFSQNAMSFTIEGASPMATLTAKSSQFSKKEQEHHQRKSLHPYALCQCIGIEQELEEKEGSLQTAQMIAMIALHEKQEYIEGRLGISTN